MPPIAIIEEALTEGRALFSAAGDLRDLFRSGRAEIESIRNEAGETVDGLLSRLRAGLDDFKAQASAIAADAKPAGSAVGDVVPVATQALPASEPVPDREAAASVEPPPASEASAEAQPGPTFGGFES